jgi:hypothetical protein
MLAKDPKDRISSQEALAHPAFETVLSKSPLIIRKAFNPNELINLQNITKE